MPGKRVARPAKKGLRGRGWLALAVALVVVAGGVLLLGRSTDLFSSGDDPGATSAESSTSEPTASEPTPSDAPTSQSPEPPPSAEATGDDSSRDAGGSGELARACAAELSAAEGAELAAAPSCEQTRGCLHAGTGSPPSSGARQWAGSRR